MKGFKLKFFITLMMMSQTLFGAVYNLPSHLINIPVANSINFGDVEYGMSGTFGECYNTEFFVIVLSNGGDFDNTTGDQRNSENENIWARYENVSGVLDVGFVKFNFFEV